MGVVKAVDKESRVLQDSKESAYDILAAKGIECVFLENSFVPVCDLECKQHDGYRCRLMGFKASVNCEPACEILCEIGLKHLQSDNP